MALINPFILAPAYPGSITVSGAGDSAFNGAYPLAGMNLGAPYYQLDGSHFGFWDGTQWNLSSGLGSGGSGAYYYAAGTAASVPTSGWAANLGAGPAPTVS